MLATPLGATTFSEQAMMFVLADIEARSTEVLTFLMGA